MGNMIATEATPATHESCQSSPAMMPRSLASEGAWARAVLAFIAIELLWLAIAAVFAARVEPPASAPTP
jgi:hypothetical protein